MPKNVMCKNCNNYRCDWCEKVIDSPNPNMPRTCQYFWARTNADRIRAMSDEELEVFLVNVDLDKAGSPFITEWGKWLKQPAEVDNG